LRTFIGTPSGLWAWRGFCVLGEWSRSACLATLPGWSASTDSFAPASFCRVDVQLARACSP